MKHLLLVLSLTCTLQCFAQDPILYEHTWYLHDLIIDGTSNPLPPDALIIPLFFTDEPPGDLNFQTIVCQEAVSEVMFDDPNSSFSFVQGFFVGGIECEFMSTAEEFETKYFDFFRDEISFPFVYGISSSNGNFTLIITSESGDRAIYGDQLLAVNDENLVEVGMYPNPVSDLLTLSSPNNEILSVHIYNLEGKQISRSERMSQNRNEIDLTNLNSGLYFLKIFFNGGQVTKKIIKK